MREQIFLNQGAVTVEVHTQMRDYSSNSERINDIINHPLIHATLIKIVLNVTVGDQINASDVDCRIISLKIFSSRKLWIRNFTGTRKSLKLAHTDQLKYIRFRKTLQMKASERRYMRLWHICL